MKRFKFFEMPRRIRRFKQDEDGVTAVEFAIVGGPFFLLIFAIIEMSIYFFATQYLETTVDEVTRMFRTGQLDSTTTEEQFRTEFCSRLAVLLECSEVQTDVRVAAEFDLLDDPDEPDEDGNLPDNAFTPSGPLQIIQVSAQAKWPVFTNFSAPMLHTPDGDYALISVVAVARTEPY